MQLISFCLLSSRQATHIKTLWGMCCQFAFNQLHTLSSLYKMHPKKAGFPFTELQLVANNLRVQTMHNAERCANCTVNTASLLCHWTVVLNWTAPGLKNEGEFKMSHLQSRCFFLGAITSCVVALQTARATSDPVSWYCAAAMRSVRVCPDIFSR